MTISYVQPLKQAIGVGLDTGYVVHTATGMVLVFERGEVIRWGVLTECSRAIESPRLVPATAPVDVELYSDFRYYREGPMRSPCTDCSKVCLTPVHRQRVDTDWFYLFAYHYRNQGVGAFVCQETWDFYRR